MAVALLLGSTALPAVAQETETRAALVQKAREEKSHQLHPYAPGKIEAGLIALEQGHQLQRLVNPITGIFPKIGGLAPGAGAALGPGLRINGLFNKQLDFLAFTEISRKRYWVTEVGASLPRLARNRFFADVRVRHEDFPQVDFYGFGIDAERADRTNYAFRSTNISAGAGLRVTPRLAVGQRLTRLTARIGRGISHRFPSTEDFYRPDEVAGLVEQPDFIRSDTFVDVDYRSPGPNAQRGGRYLVTYSRFSDRDLSRYSFSRWAFDLQQYLSTLYGHRVLALRTLVSLADADPGQQVPFYFEETLGGSHTLRGFRSFRFRDRNLLLLQGEYRFAVLSFLSGALFYDAGKVVADHKDLDLSDLKRDYGFGLRFGYSGGVFLRTDVAFGSGEGRQFLLRFNSAF